MQDAVLMSIPLLTVKSCYWAHHGPIRKCCRICGVIHHSQFKPVAGSRSQIVEGVLGDHPVCLMDGTILPVLILDEVRIEIGMVGPGRIQ